MSILPPLTIRTIDKLPNDRGLLVTVYIKSGKRSRATKWRKMKTYDPNGWQCVEGNSLVNGHESAISELLEKKLKEDHI